MPLLQDLLLVVILHGNNVRMKLHVREAMRPDEEFKASVTRATDAARARVATDEANRLEEMRRRRARAAVDEDVADELAVEKRYGSDPLYPRTFAERHLHATKNWLQDPKQSQRIILVTLHSLKVLVRRKAVARIFETVNDQNRLAGQHGLSYRLGETAADSGAWYEPSSRNVARATSAANFPDGQH